MNPLFMRTLMDTMNKPKDIHTQLNEAMVEIASLKDQNARLTAANNDLRYALTKIEDLAHDARRTQSIHT